MPRPPGRVFVVGSTNVDRTVAVAQLPRPGETALGDALVVSAGGKGANAAAAAARARATVVFVSAVGADADGEEAIATLRAEGVEVEAVAPIYDRLFQTRAGTFSWAISGPRNSGAPCGAFSTNHRRKFSSIFSPRFSFTRLW